MSKPKKFGVILSSGLRLVPPFYRINLGGTSLRTEAIPFTPTYVHQEEYRLSQCLQDCLLRFEFLSPLFVQLQRSHHSLRHFSTRSNVVLTFSRAWQITPVHFIQGSEEDVVHLRARGKPQEEATTVRSSMGKYLVASMEARRQTRLSTANGEIIISARELSQSVEKLHLLTMNH